MIQPSRLPADAFAIGEIKQAHEAGVGDQEVGGDGAADQRADDIPPGPAWRVWLNYSGGLAAFPLSVLSLLFSRRIGRWWDGREKAAD